MKNIISKQFYIIGVILLMLMISNVYSKNPKLKEVLEISNLKVKSYDIKNNTAVIEYQIKAHEKFNGTLVISSPNSPTEKTVQMNAEQMNITQQGIVTKTITVTLSENEVTMVSLNLSTPFIANGYKKDYYRYFKIIKMGSDAAILDPREKSELKAKVVGKEITVTTGKQNINRQNGVNGIESIQSMNYAINISGNIRIGQIDEGLFGNGVTLMFRNSSNPTNWYHPLLGHDRNVHYDILDEQGHFSFNFSFTGDLTTYNQVIVIVGTNNDASILPVPSDGYIVWENNSYTTYFKELLLQLMDQTVISLLTKMVLSMKKMVPYCVICN